MEGNKEGSLMQNKVVFSVGDGRKVKFWKDNWCGNFALCNSFPLCMHLRLTKRLG